MIKLNILFRYIAVLGASVMLSGCLGGTVAQQIVRSIATSIADKTMARALDVDEDQATSNRTSGNRQPDYAKAQAPSLAAPSSSLTQPYKAANTQQTNQAQIKKNLANQNLEKYNLTKRSLLEAQHDPYKIAITNTAFEQIKPIAEPLPNELVEAENTVEVIQSSQLVRVELFNLLIGEEKNAVYEQARLMGSASLPQKREWALWRVATGAVQLGQNQSSHNQPSKKLITFLIPPEFGKLPSGAVTMVELARPGELNVARYKAN